MENLILNYNITENITINEFLTRNLNLSVRLKNKLIKNKLILLNGVFVDTRETALVGDVLTIDLSFPEDNSNIAPTKMNLEIIYEDNYILAINKPSGIAVHPSILHFDDSLANGVKYYFDTINLHKKIRAVNRIDLNTSGLVLFAKIEYIQECLIRQMNNSDFKKTYLAVVEGNFDKACGTINAPIARKENSIIEREINKNGQTAITHYKVLKSFAHYSLVQCILETGRTHQIRVHMAHIGHPLLGDTLYGSNQILMNRQALHSYKMEFIHPISKKIITLEAPIANDIKQIL